MPDRTEVPAHRDVPYPRSTDDAIGLGYPKNHRDGVKVGAMPRVKDDAVDSTSNSACIIATRLLARVSLLSPDPASHDLFRIAVADAAKPPKLRVRLLGRALRPPARLEMTFCAARRCRLPRSAQSSAAMVAHEPEAHLVGRWGNCN